MAFVAGWAADSASRGSPGGRSSNAPEPVDSRMLLLLLLPNSPAHNALITGRHYKQSRRYQLLLLGAVCSCTKPVQSVGEKCVQA